MTDAQWGFSGPSGSTGSGGSGLGISNVGGGRRGRDIDSALRFDLTRSARRARLGLSRNVSATSSSSDEGHHHQVPGGSSASGLGSASASGSGLGTGGGVSWGDFINAGFDARERDRSGGTAGLSISTSGPIAHGSKSQSQSPMSPSLRGGGSGTGIGTGMGTGTGYLDTEGKPTDVGEFTLDIGLDMAELRRVTFLKI